jgi:hypothetical protein
VLTIFTIPKPFLGHIGAIQRNAILSWLALVPPCQVILLGDDEGTVQIAEEFGVLAIPDIAVNGYGTPLLNDAFARAEAAAEFDVVCYVNADIVLPTTFPSCVSRIPTEKYLMIGQRIDVDVPTPIGSSDTGLDAGIERLAAEQGVLHPASGSDYFVFPKGCMGMIPPFAVGRPGWDNWMIFRARQLRVPVVDASHAVLVIHQNHGYAHVPNGGGRDSQGPEAVQNLELVGGWDQTFLPEDADWVLTGTALARKRPDWSDPGRRLRVAAVLSPGFGPLLRACARLVDRVLELRARLARRFGRTK